MSEKIAEQLADKVSNTVISSGVREEILQALLNNVKGNVHEAVLEALLIYAGNKIGERDREWVRNLSSIWAPRSAERMASSPAEVEEEIREWVSGREKDIRMLERRTGYQEGFKAAIVQGAKLGWGGAQAVKNLDEVLAASEKVRP